MYSLLNFYRVESESNFLNDQVQLFIVVRIGDRDTVNSKNVLRYHFKVELKVKIYKEKVLQNVVIK